MSPKQNPTVVAPSDWRRVDAMNDEEILTAAISDPDCPPATEEQLARAVAGRRVRLLRTRLGLSQEAFAHRYGLPLEMVQAWERGRTKPDAAATALLKVIEQEPEIAARVLADPVGS
jgi:putative transcriptional regulator